MGVYRGTSFDNLVANGGSLYGVDITGSTLTDATLTGATLTGGTAVADVLVLPTASAANIAAIGHSVNTAGKAAGKVVFDTTNSKIKIATAATAAGTWVDADGDNAVTPA